MNADTTKLDRALATLERRADGPKENVEKGGPILAQQPRRSKSRRDRARKARARRRGR